jgi:hypothetical protein
MYYNISMVFTIPHISGGLFHYMSLIALNLNFVMTNTSWKYSWLFTHGYKIVQGSTSFQPFFSSCDIAVVLGDREVQADQAFRPFHLYHPSGIYSVRCIVTPRYYTWRSVLESWGIFPCIARIVEIRIFYNIGICVSPRHYPGCSYRRVHTYRPNH